MHNPLADIWDKQGIRRRFFDSIAMIVIEFFKDSWGIYQGRLTHANLAWNILRNTQRAVGLNLIII